MSVSVIASYPAHTKTDRQTDRTTDQIGGVGLNKSFDQL